MDMPSILPARGSRVKRHKIAGLPSTSKERAFRRANFFGRAAVVDPARKNGETHANPLFRRSMPWRKNIGRYVDPSGSEKDSQFSLTAAELGIAGHDFHVRQSRLRGGLAKESIASKSTTAGSASWCCRRGGWAFGKAGLASARSPATVEVGWQSPVDGPVHPQFVPLADPSGLGFLDGFDELIVRCGLESNGAPEFDERGDSQVSAARPHRQPAGRARSS